MGEYTGPVNDPGVMIEEKAPKGLPTFPEQGRMQWYRDVRSVQEEHGITRAIWDCNGSFVKRNRIGKDIYEKLIDVLLK